VQSLLSVASNFLAPRMHTLVIVLQACLLPESQEARPGDDADGLEWFPWRAISRTGIRRGCPHTGPLRGRAVPRRSRGPAVCRGGSAVTGDDRLRRLPKVELHRHLDGSVRIDTLWEIARENDIDVGAGSLEELRGKAVIRSPMKDLGSVLACFAAQQASSAPSRRCPRHIREYRGCLPRRGAAHRAALRSCFHLRGKGPLQRPDHRGRPGGDAPRHGRLPR